MTLRRVLAFVDDNLDRQITLADLAGAAGLSAMHFAAQFRMARMAAVLSRGGGRVLPTASMGMTTAMRQAMYDVVHRFWNTDDADPKAAARDLRIAIERTRD